MARVLAYLLGRLKKGPLHMTLIDPEKSPGAAAGRIAEAAARLGTDAIMLGGSTGISVERMTGAAEAVRKVVSLPIIVFPEGPGSLTPAADAIYFLSLLNSKNPERIIGMQARSALAIRALGLEAIPLGYVVVAPGMRVGEVGEADPVPRDDLERARSYALAAEYFGMSLVYLEAGSGAPAPVPAPMVRAVRGVLGIPLVVGGGIRSAPEAHALLAAGAQILVTGTVTETEGVGAGFEGILAEVRKARGD